jgi:hypothetical protein
LRFLYFERKIIRTLCLLPLRNYNLQEKDAEFHDKAAGVITEKIAQGKKILSLSHSANV